MDPVTEKIVVKIEADMAELIPPFIENRHADIAAMREALPKGDYAFIQRTGHGMKGAGAGFGFGAVTEIGAAIEQAAKDKNDKDIQKGIEELAGYMRRLEVVYEA